MIRILAIVFVYFFSISAYGQIDTEFWFAAPEISENHADRPIFLRISTMDEAAEVAVDIPNDDNFPGFYETISANSTISIDLSFYIDELENSPSNTVLNKGLHITSTAEITAYYEVLGTNYLGAVNCDIFTLKGKNALGTKFYIPLQNYWSNYSGQNLNAFSSFDIVATQDNTNITITPTQDLDGGRAANAPFTITLNKGQTFSCRSLGTDGAQHATGSLVTSDKPIAITIKDDSIYNDPGWDLAGDQLVPVDHTGNDYIIVKASDAIFNTDRIFICATQDNTEIYLKGNPTPFATIQAGQTISYQLQGDEPTLYVTTSAPVYINHIAGFSSEIAGAILPPLTCTGSRRVSFTRPNLDDLVINLVVKAGKEKYFKLNNYPYFSSSFFQIVPGTNNVWMAAQFKIGVDIIPPYTNAMISNDSADFQMSIMSGNVNTFRYGFFSDFAGLELGPDAKVCQGDSLLLNAGFGKSSYEWSTGEKTQKIYIKDAGNYSVKITKGSCALQDEMNLSYYPAVNEFLTLKDTTLCAKLPLTIGTDSIFPSYKWNTGAITPKINPTNSGDYTLEVKNQYGCKKKDTVHVHFLPLPRAVISYSGDDEKICWDSLLTLQAPIGTYQYKWSTGETTPTITSHKFSGFALTITDVHECKDSTTFNLDCSPFIKVYNLITPDNNNLNDVFFVERLTPGKWILEIYNRWGARVYYNESYANNYNGEDLADDVYYYTLKHVDGKKTINGWFQVIRK